MSDTRYHILYDAQCNLCTGARRLFELIGAADRSTFVDIHDSTAMARFPQVSRDRALGQMHLVDEIGNVFGGYDAVVEGLGRAPGFAPLHALLSTRLMQRLGRRAYAWIARNRYRLFGRNACGGTCALPAR